MSRFLGFGTALPEHRLEPSESLAALERLWPRLRSATALQPVTRYLCEPLDHVLRPRPLGETTLAYGRHARRLAAQASRLALARSAAAPAEIDLVVSASCTGYLVPSLDVALAAELGLRDDVIRLPLTELGCSAGAAAVAAAHRHLAAYPRDRVLVVAVETPSLNFQPGDRSLDNLTAAMVFGDGAAATVMDAGQDGFQVLSCGSRMLPGTSGMLGFDLRDRGFHVVLDRRLPRLIADRLGAAVAGFAARHEVGRPSFYAVHAGGPRVFDAVEAALGLAGADLQVSRRVFREVGNLSSASLLFSLAALPETPGEGLALAFGPGVTIELAHLRRGPG